MMAAYKNAVVIANIRQKNQPLVWGCERGWGKKKRTDRLATFGTLEDGNIEQPFKPIKSVGKGGWAHPPRG